MANAAGQAYAQLRDDILSGALAPLQRLKEVDLAESLGMSRTPIREAVKRLILEGLLTREPGAGLRVASIAPDEVEQVFEIRILLESHAARRAAKHATEEDIIALRHLAQTMTDLTPPRTQDDYRGISQANSEFHRMIVQAAASPRLAALVASAVDMGLVLRTYRTYSPADLVRSAKHHHEIVDAIAKRAPEWASHAMATHLQAAASIASDPGFSGG